MSNSQTILSQNTHAGDSAVQTLTGEKFRGDGFYGRSDGLHTIQIDLNGFIGRIEIQGTLAVEPAEEDWFSATLGTGNQSVDTTGLIREENINRIDFNQPTTTVKSYNFTGNYVWIRAKVSNWTDGAVNSIKMNH